MRSNHVKNKLQSGGISIGTFMFEFATPGIGQIAAQAGVAQHVIAEIDLRIFGGSALTSDITVPKGRSTSEMSQGVPVTYVPARNTVFLSFALGGVVWACGFLTAGFGSRGGRWWNSCPTSGT